jgi:small subunit ribosomal protein S6
VPYYETVVVVDPTSQEGTDEKHLSAIRDVISAQQGTIAKVEHWGKRKLAYSIRHKREGIYFLVEFEAPGDAVAKLEQYCRLQESILRYLTVSRESPSPEGEVSPIAKEATTEEPERVEPGEPAEAIDSIETQTDELLVRQDVESLEQDEMTEKDEVEEIEAEDDEPSALLEPEASESLLADDTDEQSEEEKEETEER